jgi:hypothetical protein
MHQGRLIPRLLLASVVLLYIPTIPAQEAAAPAAWPELDLARFVFEHLDISSFRNSTGPRRGRGERFLGDLGVQPNRVTETEAIADEGGWSYGVRILGKRDYNKDDVEEVLICFSDRSLDGGSYNTTKHLIVQLVEGRAIALAYTQDQEAEEAGCGSAR